MPEFRYGPIEFYLVGFEGERPDPATMQAFVELLHTGLVRLDDFALISKAEDGTVTVTEVEDDAAALGLEGIEVVATGLAADADIEEFAEHIPPGGSAVLVGLELLYARDLAEKLAASGGVVLRSERVPAPIVNAVLDLIDAEEV